MRQRVIRLTDDKNFSRLMAAAARYQNLQTVPRVKRIEDPPLSLLIPGSMSLPRPAVGKSWLACALGHKACRENLSVFYTRAPELFADLAIAHGDARYARLLRSLARVRAPHRA